MARSKLLVRLRYCGAASFNKSEETNFNEVPASVRRSLRGGDAVMIVSMTGNQAFFVHKPIEDDDGDEFLFSQKVRWSKKRPFDGKALQHYAGKAGLELEGIKHYSEYVGIDADDE